jgi:DNA-directed RNA polymerase sigma subunit (sigma70/sigma32)
MESEIFNIAYTYIQRYKPLELIRVHATQQTIKYCREHFPTRSQDDVERAVLIAWRQHIERNGRQHDRERQRLSQALTALAQESATVSLTSREQEVLSLRFGLNNRRIHSLADIGRQFQITRERVRQIEESALRKLKQHYG